LLQPFLYDRWSTRILLQVMLLKKAYNKHVGRGGHPGMFDFSKVPLPNDFNIEHEDTTGVMEALNFTVSHFVHVQFEAWSHWSHELIKLNISLEDEQLFFGREPKFPKSGDEILALEGQLRRGAARASKPSPAAASASEPSPAGASASKPSPAAAAKSLPAAAASEVSMVPYFQGTEIH
jgi:hypothetical protein